MKQFSFMCYKISIAASAIYLIFTINIMAQQNVSAEFISSLEPMSLSTGEKIEDGVRGVMYHNQKLYVTNVWAGIQCVNVDDVKNPKEMGKFETEHRPHNIFVGEKYCYVSDELEGVTILDISNPKLPVKTGKINTQGNAFWVEASFPYVYVAEERFGIQVYDISDVKNPVHVGGFDTPGWAWYLSLKENYVYVGDKNGGLQIIDFSDKTNPVRLGQYQNLHNARTVFVDGNYAYISNGPNGMAILDISNPKFPALVSTYPTNGYIFDLFKAGNNVYLADEVNRRVDILNVADVTHPMLQGFYQAEGKVYSVWKEDVYLFVAADDKLLLLRHNNPPNLAPIANQQIDENKLLTITPKATEPDGDPIYFELSYLPEGAIFDSLRGSITWTPTFEQSGMYENITLTVTERTKSKLSASKSFNITVNHVNRPPIMTQVGDTIVSENIPFSFFVGEGSDPDKEDLGKLIYNAENLPEGAIFDSISRQFSWTPSFEQSGVYTIDFVINDPAGGSDRDAANITVLHVDRKPEVVAVEDQVINENEELSLTMAGSDADKEDQNAISFKIDNLPPGAVFDAESKIFSWTPSYEQSGEYKDILLVMTAGKMSDSTTFNITVNHVNRPPELEDIADQSVDESKMLAFSINGNDDDGEDSGKLTFAAFNLPEGANFNTDSLLFSWTPSFEQSGIYENVLFTVTDPSGLSDSQNVKITVKHINRPPQMDEVPPYVGNENEEIIYKITGSDPDAEDLDKLVFEGQNLPEGAVFSEQTLNWTPTYEQSGEYTITFNLSDGQLSDSKSTSFTINHVNRAPVIDSLVQQTTDENKQLQFIITASDPDAEDAGKFVLSASGLPAGASFDPTTSTFTWLPDYDQSGEYQVIFTNTDPAGLTNSKNVSIVVNHINRTPVFNPLPAQNVDENQPLSYVIPAGEDPDKEDADKLVYAAKDLPQGAAFDPISRSLTWTPTFEQSGEYSPVFSLTDGEFTIEQPLKITVNHVNRAPMIESVEPKTVNENSPLQFDLVTSDPDNEDQGKTTLLSTELPAGATFDNQSGSFSWKPTYEQSGEYNITFTITDPAGLTATQTASINVVNVNREPTLKSVPSQSVVENTPLSLSFEASDEDKEDNGKLTFSGTNLPEGSTLDASTGVFMWTPNFLQAGQYNFEVKVTDMGGLSGSVPVEIEVKNLNRPPVMNPIEDKSVAENSTLTFTVSGSDEDTDDKLTYSLSDLPDGAEFDENSGNFSWTPDFTQAAEYTLIATISDGESEANTSFKIIVENANRKPTIEKGGSVSVMAGETASLIFSATDEDDDDLTFSSDNLPEGASLTSDGDFSWTPDENQVGTFVFTVTVTDGTDSAQTSASVAVNPVPPPEPEQN